MAVDASPEKMRPDTRHLRLGAIVAVLAFAVDQGHKWWMLEVFGIAERGVVTVTSFFDLYLVWNKGISYGLFQQESQTGQWILLAITMVIVAIMARWLYTAGDALVAVAVGLVIGGALGNALDRLVHGAVADFFSFHITIGGAEFRWYVFNLADVAIVAGVALLLYDSLLGNKETAD